MRIVVGLGNPGRRYEDTRHNAGFLVVSRLAERWGIAVDRKQLGSLVGDGAVRGQKVVLCMPQAFMNLSGHPVRSLMGFYKCGPQDLTVVHDEVDLPFGQVRVKVGGGHGGHNGLRDIHKHLDDLSYARVRFGVGRPPAGWDTADYVLGRWSTAERDALSGLVEEACDAVELLVEQGPTAAMNQFNIRQRKPQEPAAKARGEAGASSTTVD